MATKWTQEKVEERLLPALKELGTGPNKVAEALLAKKCMGERGSATDCPTAKFVKKLFRSATEIAVDSDTIDIEFGDEIFSVKPPAAVVKFIENFDGDNERYPELAIAGED
jgi:hypothetical protein